MKLLTCPQISTFKVILAVLEILQVRLDFNLLGWVTLSKRLIIQVVI